MNARIENITTQNIFLREQQLRQQLHKNVANVEHLRCFMEHYVFVLWAEVSVWSMLRDECLAGSIKKLVAERHNTAVSNLDAYMENMRQMRADTFGIESLIKRVEKGESVTRALLKTPYLSTSAAHFVLNIFQAIGQNTHEWCAAVLLGLSERTMTPNRPDEHNQQYNLLVQLCGNDQYKWLEAQQTACRVLEIKINFWGALDVNMRVAALQHAA